MGKSASTYSDSVMGEKIKMNEFHSLTLGPENVILVVKGEKVVCQIAKEFPN